MTMKNLALFIIPILLFVSCNESDNNLLQLTLDSGDLDLVNSPVYADVNQPDLGDNDILCVHSESGVSPAQVQALSDTEKRIWWQATQSAGSVETYEFHRNGDCHEQAYNWHSAGDFSTQLQYGDQVLMQYEHPVYDPEEVEQTKKPFHHIYDPSGSQLITKGPGGLYTHHRGIFFGYNHVYTNDRRIDIWHARDGERSEHESVVREFAGPVMGGHIVNILWKNHDGEPFLDENREIRLFRLADDMVVIDFYSTLQTSNGPVVLGGDRQHAGVQFRAAQYVADNADQTQYIRPGYLSHREPDDEIDGDDMMDLPWNAMRFVVEGNTYTVAYLSHPANPDGAEMSERLYGRFGEFFPYEVTPGQPLVVNYRFVVKSGHLDADEIERHYQLYSDAPDIVVN
jgi:hypothetical protein